MEVDTYWAIISLDQNVCSVLTVPALGVVFLVNNYVLRTLNNSLVFVNSNRKNFLNLIVTSLIFITSWHRFATFSSRSAFCLISFSFSFWSPLVRKLIANSGEVWSSQNGQHRTLMPKLPSGCDINFIYFYRPRPTASLSWKRRWTSKCKWNFTQKRIASALNNS